MTVKEPIKELKKIEDKTLEVFFPERKFIGNITEVGDVQESTHGFFGKPVPCIMLGGEPPEEDTE